jgi:hypothetical protein
LPVVNTGVSTGELPLMERIFAVANGPEN